MQGVAILFAYDWSSTNRQRSLFDEEGYSREEPQAAYFHEEELGKFIVDHFSPAQEHINKVKAQTTKSTSQQSKTHTSVCF